MKNKKAHQMLLTDQSWRTAYWIFADKNNKRSPMKTAFA
jgi:hypothetical protein